MREFIMLPVLIVLAPFALLGFVLLLLLIHTGNTVGGWFDAGREPMDLEEHSEQCDRNQ